MLFGVYQITIQFVLPFLILAVRLNAKSEVLGDNIYKLAKIAPMESVISSIQFNSDVLRSIARFRINNVSGVGPDVEADELDTINA